MKPQDTQKQITLTPGRLEITSKNEIAHYVYPREWTHVTLAQYLKILAMPSDITWVEETGWLLQSLCTMPEEVLLSLPVDTIRALAKEMDFMVRTAPPIEVDTIQAGGWTWRRRTDFSGITYGEIVSLQTVNKRGIQSLPEMLCILLERIDEEGNAIAWDTEAQTAAEDFGNTSVTLVTGVLENFLNGSNG